MIAHALTSAETLSFLARHPDIAVRVAEFTEIVNTVGYDQAPQPPGGWNVLNWDILDYYLRQLPGWIPSWGLAVVDTVWPYVIIFPDATGVLRYTGTDTIPADIAKPPYEPPPGHTPIDDITALVVLAVAAYLFVNFSRSK